MPGVDGRALVQAREDLAALWDGYLAQVPQEGAETLTPLWSYVLEGARTGSLPAHLGPMVDEFGGAMASALRDQVQQAAQPSTAQTFTAQASGSQASAVRREREPVVQEIDGIFAEVGEPLRQARWGLGDGASTDGGRAEVVLPGERTTLARGSSQVPVMRRTAEPTAPTLRPQSAALAEEIARGKQPVLPASEAVGETSAAASARVPAPRRRRWRSLRTGSSVRSGPRRRGVSWSARRTSSCRSGPGRG